MAAHQLDVAGDDISAERNRSAQKKKVFFLKRMSCLGKQHKFIHLFSQNLPLPSHTKKCVSPPLTVACTENAGTVSKPVSWPVTSIIAGKTVPLGPKFFYNDRLFPCSSGSLWPCPVVSVVIITRTSVSHLVQLKVKPALIQGQFTLHLTQ